MFCTKADLAKPVHIISDIDKTYLETAFESLTGLAKIAVETADEKRTVDGARVFLRHLKWGEGKLSEGILKGPPLHFVSSSPPQLRAVLEEKISMDALTWSSDSFKDQIYNLRTGKLKMLKHQVSYKLASILSLVESFTNPQRLLLIGDNAESDPFIFFIVKALLEKKMSFEQAPFFLSHLDVTPQVCEQIFSKLRLEHGYVQVDILIRNVKGVSEKVPENIHGVVHFFDDYFQASLIACWMGYLEPNDLLQVLLSMHNYYGYDLNRGSSMMEFFFEEVAEFSDHESAFWDKLSSLRAMYGHPFLAVSDRELLTRLKLSTTITHPHTLSYEDFKSFFMHWVEGSD